MWRARCCESKARPTPVAIGASAGGASLRRELASLPLKDLRKRAKADGMPAADLEDAMDADDPEELFTSFLVQMHADAAGGGGSSGGADGAGCALSASCSVEARRAIVSAAVVGDRPCVPCCTRDLLFLAASVASAVVFERTFRPFRCFWMVFAALSNAAAVASAEFLRSPRPMGARAPGASSSRRADLASRLKPAAWPLASAWPWP